VNPLLQLFTYGLVFIVILPTRGDPQMQPYLLFFFCGILPWTWFNASLLEAASVLIAGGSLIKKVMFPAEVLPVVTVLTNLAHFLLGLPILLLALAAYGRLAPAALLLPLPIAVQLVLTVGLALVVSALTVHFRDLQNILGHLVHLWFFASPILYYYGTKTGRARTLLRLNPMSHLLVSYQQMLFEGHFDHWRGLFATGLVAVLAFWLGAFLFDRLRDTLAEEV